MFVDKERISEGEYLVLLFLLNTTQNAGNAISVNALAREFEKIMPRDEIEATIDSLSEKSLVRFWTKDGAPTYLEREKDSNIGLSFIGFALLVNYAEEYLQKIQQKYHELPENLTATLIPFLELSKVPAADRYVSTSDNLPEFQNLTRSLETIKLELVKDQNANELPVKNKRGVVAEIEGILAQIKGGFVRLSDLTTRVRPLVRGIAEVCKDVTIIAIAAQQAYQAIEKILTGLF